MPNEFVIRNGFISKGNSIVEGGFTATTISASTYSNLPSPSITVGTSQLTSGTDTRVLFQSGTTLQQDGNFTFDPTLKRLTLKAVGTAATDIPFAVQNSGGTGVLFQATGDGKHSFNMTPNTNFALSIDQTNQNGGIAVYNSGQATFLTARIAGSVGYMGVLNNGNYSFFTANSSYFNHSLVVGGNSLSPGARLDVRAQGALSTDIAFRVRNSADTADLISFRGDGSQWIQSVPFIHAAFATGTNNANQGILLGYNVASLSTTSLNCVVIGRGSGAILQGNGNTIIGDGFTQGTFTNSIGLGRGVFVSNSNHFFCGSDSFPVNTWWVSTGGEASSGANLRGLDFRVSGMAGGPGNISAAAHPVRFFSPNGTGNGAGSNIQFHVAPSNTGGASFNRNIFSEMFTIRGEADGLNHYQLATPRVPSVSITDGYIQYSNDIIAGNAAPHFRTENGSIVKLYQNANTVAIDDNLINLGVRASGGTSTFTNPVSVGSFSATTGTINGNLTITGDTTMPNRSAFSVYGAGTTNNLTTTQNGDGTLNTNNFGLTYSQGTGFDISTGIFTAPIAGLYQVTLIGRNSGFAGGISQLAVIRNNSNASGNVMMIEWAASSSMNHTGGGQIFRLAVGDTLRLKVLAGQINFDGNDNWSVAYIG